MKNKRIFVIAVIDVVVFLLGVLAAARFKHNGFLAFAIGAIAITTGVVIAFYFGSSAFIDSRRYRDPKG